MIFFETDNKELDIRRNSDLQNVHFRMQINIAEFVACRSITKMNKLFEIISKSDTPGEALKIKDFCSEYITHSDSATVELEAKVVGYETKITQCYKSIKGLTEIRDKFKKSSEEYKNYNHQVKAAKAELQHLKNRFYSVKYDLGDIQRNAVFCKKVLKIPD